MLAFAPFGAAQAVLITSDADSFLSAGRAVDVSGDTLVTSSVFAGCGGESNVGAAYAFVRAPASGTPGTWTEQQQLCGSTAVSSDRFGSSVAIEGDTIVVGSPDPFASGGPGLAYVFVRQGTSWAEQDELSALDSQTSDEFGACVALSGDTAAASAPRDDTSAGAGAGSVYLFVRSGTAWSMEQKIEASDAGANDRFGGALALAGDVALVGAREHDGLAGNDTGAAYVFRRTGAVWSEEQQLLASDAQAGDLFGASVALNEDRLIVGASRLTNPSDVPGKAYVFERQGTTWVETAVIQSPAPDNDGFGTSVDLLWDRCIVGAPQVAGDSKAYLYRLVGTTWAEVDVLQQPFGDFFGNAVALGDEIAVVGDPLGDDAFFKDNGIVYVYDVGTSSSFCDGSDGALASCPCANVGHPTTGCDLAQGTGGVRMDIVTQQQGAQNRATLVGSGYPVMSAPAVTVLRGSALDVSSPVPFGDGLRCVASPVVRLAGTAASGGQSTHTFGHGTMAGTGDFFYQLWFRNTPVMFCTPEAFNLSNGRSLTW